jgi:hypothetical protein
MSAQGTQTTPDGSTLNGLLLEVRALRVEVRQITSAGIRTQLLVARLQLQEQRVLTAARQLAETESALAALQGRIAGERIRVRQLEEAGARATGQGRIAFQQVVVEAGAQIDQQQRQELHLQTREKELQRALSDEQARWTDFSDRLDALERALPGSTPNFLAEQSR